jgi:hypothetical protein
MRKPVNKKSGPAEKQQVSKRSKVERGKVIHQGRTLFNALDGVLERHLSKIFWVLFGISILISILMFDVRFSVAGDDSSYVTRANDLLKHFTYPGFQGPLYPIVLAPVIWLFGISSIPLKSLSIIFMAGFFYFTYKAFRNRIPAMLTIAVLSIVAVNAFILYFASQTYSEMLFMFLQALMIYVLFIFFVDRDKPGRVPGTLKMHLVLGLCILGLGLTRSIGFTAAIAIAAWFLVTGNWKNLLLLILATATMIALFQGIKFLVWGSADFTLSMQGNGLLNKDYYNPVQGREDLAGFIQRIIQNSNTYITRHFYTMIGLRDYSVQMKELPWLNIATWLIFFGGAGLVFRKNRYILFFAVYTLVLLLTTFIVLQTRWDQGRLIVPFVAYLMLVILSAFYYLFTLPGMARFQWIFPVGLLVLMGLNISATSGIVKEARKIDGIYYGLSPDWENYTKMSNWASENLPDSAIVACRKPSISFIYGSKGHFFGIMRLPDYPVTSLMNNWKKTRVPYVIIGSTGLANKPVSNPFIRTFKNGLVAEINREGEVNYVVMVPDSVRERTFAELNGLQIRYGTDPDSLGRIFRPDAGYYAIYPDSLLGILRKARVTHILTANLRVKADQKSGETINTVERFASIIVNKYPAFLNRIAQTGADNNEPATIYQLDYYRCTPIR